MKEDKLTLDYLSDIDGIREYLIDRITDKELLEKVRHSSSLSFLRGIYYGLNHPIRLDYQKLKNESY